MKSSRLLLLFVYSFLCHSVYCEESAPVESPYDAQTISDAVDFLVAAIGTQNPEPVMSTVLSATPDAIKSVITFNSNTNMQTLALAIMDEPDREQELLEVMNRYQAILSAINGDNSQWKRICAASQADRQRKNTAGRSRDSTAQEEKDSLDFQLDWLEEQTSRLEAEKSGFPDFSRWNYKIEHMFLEATDLQYQRANYKIRIEQYLKSGEFYVGELNDIQARMESELQLGATLESSIIAAIEAALLRAQRCETSADDRFIMDRYREAKVALQTLNTKLNLMNELLKLAAEKTEQIKTLNKELEKLYFEREWDELAPRFYKSYNEYDLEFYRLRERSGDVSTFNRKVQKLQREISDSRSYYEPLFPNTSIQFEILSQRLEEILFDEAAIAAIRKTVGEKFQLLKAAREEFLNNQSVLAWNVLRVEFPPLNSFKDRYEEVEALHFLAVTKMKANTALANGCPEETGEGSTSEESGNEENDGLTSTEEGPLSDSGDTENIITFDRPTEQDIMISGPSTIIAGEWVEFTARNGNGVIYPDPSVLNWTKTRDELVTIQNGKNPTLASAFKAGMAQFIVVHTGLQKSAMHTVTIKARVPNLNGMDGKVAYLLIQSLNLIPGTEVVVDELSGTRVTGQTPSAGFEASEGQIVKMSVISLQEDADENLFATAGGAQVDVGDLDSEPGRFQDYREEEIAQSSSCESLRDKIAVALRHRNAREALNLAAMAAAIGCDLNFGGIAAIIEEIERENQLEQAAFDRESERMTREHQAWVKHYEEEQQAFRDQLDRNRPGTEEDPQGTQTRDFMHEMINYWYAQSQNAHDRDQSETRVPGNNPNPGDEVSTSPAPHSDQNQSHEVTYWDNGNMKEERFYDASGTLRKKIIYEKKTGFFVSETQYYPNGRRKYLMTHWHNSRDDLGIGREKFYNENGKLIKEIGYNQDGTVRESHEY